MGFRIHNVHFGGTTDDTLAGQRLSGHGIILLHIHGTQFVNLQKSAVFRLDVGFGTGGSSHTTNVEAEFQALR